MEVPGPSSDGSIFRGHRSACGQNGGNEPREDPKPRVFKQQPLGRQGSKGRGSHMCSNRDALLTSPSHSCSHSPVCSCVPDTDRIGQAVAAEQG